MHVAFALVVSTTLAVADWQEVTQGGKPVLLDPRCEALKTDVPGPFVKLGNGNVLAVDDAQVLVSEDEGQTWTPGPLFSQPEKFQCCGERILLRTREGTLLLAFLNTREAASQEGEVQGSPKPGSRLSLYVTRSADDGQTWEEPERLLEGCYRALQTMIQLRGGRVLLGCQAAAGDPGRDVSITFASDDDGKTWKAGGVIDLGEEKRSGNHGEASGATFVELMDGRLWMLLGTERGRFAEAFSHDQGLTWTKVRPSPIDSRGSPGLLKRLHDSRLVLFWNGCRNEGDCAGRREQLLMAFSEDDGRTWTAPAVLARPPMPPGAEEPPYRLAGPRAYEHVPGELWVTTMRGPLRVRFREDDFFARRLSTKTYAIRFLPDAEIVLDGRADEPAWARANVEKRFHFPWTSEPAPPTEFRAVCDRRYLYFHFRVHDEDIVVLDVVQDEQDLVLEDRVELYFAVDDQLHDYYCIEIDSRGRVFDYRARYYRRFDTAWDLECLEVEAAPLPDGYQVEGRIPLASLRALGLPSWLDGERIRCGLYRAEFSHDRSGQTAVARESIHNLGRQAAGPPPIEAWMSWIDPGTVEPDFHVPSSFGFLELAK